MGDHVYPLIFVILFKNVFISENMMKPTIFAVKYVFLLYRVRFSLERYHENDNIYTNDATIFIDQVRI